MKKRTRKTYQSQVTKIKKRKTSTNQQRNWFDLPEDVKSLIFMKLGAIEILLHAQHVCSSWRKLAEQPHIYSSIVLSAESWDYFKVYEHFEKYVREAVDRSHGQLVMFSSCDVWIKPELLHYVCSRSYLLKSLRLGRGPVAPTSVVVLKDALIRLPFLEELDVQPDMCYSRKLINQLGRSCSKLSCLRFNYCEDMEFKCDRQASAIAKYLPRLRRLHLTGCVMTNNGLQAILDGCTRLEYFDCRNCFSLTLDENLLKRCASRIKNLWLPDSRISEDCNCS